VESGTDNYAEKGKRAKTEIPKDEKQRRTEITAQNTIFRRESKVLRNRQKRKNQFTEGVLQHGVVY